MTLTEISSSTIKNRNSEPSERKKMKQKNLESRKIRKPLMEKRRRARINQSLNELKRILIEANETGNKKDGSRPSKLEKADILELTVQHLLSLHSSGRCESHNMSISSSCDSTDIKEEHHANFDHKNQKELSPDINCSAQLDKLSEIHNDKSQDDFRQLILPNGLNKEILRTSEGDIILIVKKTAFLKGGNTLSLAMIDKYVSNSKNEPIDNQFIWRPW